MNIVTRSWKVASSGATFIICAFGLIGGVALLGGVWVTTELSVIQDIALLLSLVITISSLVVLFRFLLSREAHEVAEAILEALPNPVYLKTAGGRYASVNTAWQAFFGVTRDAVIDRTAQDVDTPHRRTIERLDASDDAVRQRSGFHVYMDVITKSDGMHHDALICKATCVRGGGRIAGVVGSIIDMTDRKRTERRMMMEHAITRVLAEAERLDEVVPTIIKTICQTMGWHYGALYRYYRRDGLLRCEEMWGIDTAPIRAFMAGVGRRSVNVADGGKGLVRRAFALGKPVWISDIATDETLQRKALVLQAGLHGAFAFPLRGGSEVLGILEFFHASVLQPDPMLLEIAESIGSQIGHYIVRRKAEAKQHLAMHDALTGLPNRLLFMQRLEHAIVQSQRHGRQLAVLFIDLDHFKAVNDTLGHEAGDVLLKDVARRLKLIVREGDTVARLGGDEFVMLLEEITTAPEVMRIGEAVIGELRSACSNPSRNVAVTASVGISTYPTDGLDSATLLRHADAAMYRAKAGGRNLCELYSGCPTNLPRCDTTCEA